MADIQNGYSLTLKRGTDLFTIQGTDYPTFKANLNAFLSDSEPPSVIHHGFKPVTEAEATEAVAPTQAAAPEPQAAAPQAAPKASGESATKRQVDFMFKVAEERGLGREDLYAKAAQVTGHAVNKVTDLTKQEASAVIDSILDQPAEA